VGNQIVARGLMCSILPPGMMIKAHHIGGDADTQIRIGMVWIVAPVGMIIISTGTSGENTP